MTLQITPTQKTPKLAAADRRTHAHLMETVSNHHLSTKPPSHIRTTAPLKRTSHLQKMASRLDTETTPHHSDAQNTETLNSANIYGPLKKITFTTLKVKKIFPNSELKVKTYEIFRPYFDRTSSVNDMNVKKMNFKKVFLTPLGG